MELRHGAAGSRQKWLFWVAVNLLVVACFALAARRGEPRNSGPPEYMLKIGAAARALSPQVGEMAPDFTLPTLDGDRQVTLAEFRGERPVVLVFGSYTCPIFRDRFDAVNQAYDKYKDEAQFLFVYIREAHPEEEGLLPENESLTPVRQHRDLQERSHIALTCAARLNAQMLAVVDQMDNHVANRYQAWPERLYVIDRRGYVAYGGSGAGDFNADAMSAALARVLQTDDRIAAVN